MPGPRPQGTPCPLHSNVEPGPQSRPSPGGFLLLEKQRWAEPSAATRQRPLLSGNPRAARLSSQERERGAEGGGFYTNSGFQVSGARGEARCF